MSKMPDYIESKSDDIGTFCIELVDGEWVENRDRQLPEYIRSIGEIVSE